MVQNVVVIVAMDFFDGRHYRINKILLSCLGLWPYQRKAERVVIVVALVLVASTQMAAKISGLIMSLSDLAVAMNCVTPLVIDIMSGMKMFNSIFNANKIKMLMDRLESDWSYLKTEEELRILDDFAERGRRFTIIYSSALYIAMVLFLTMPFLPVLLNSLSSGNLTELPMIHNVEYFIDMRKYYYPILLHACMTVIICISLVIALDVMFVIFVQHACGLFTAVGYRLEHLADKQLMSADLCPSINEDECYHVVAECVQKHNKAIEFADLIESSYTVLHLLQAGLNMIIISITGAQAVLNLDKLHELIRLIILMGAQLCHLYFESLLSQRLIDYSAQVQSSLLHADWYRTSFRTRKAMNFMIMRSQEPCMLTAGGYMVMSMETFSVILRTSMSYFTMLCTFQ